MRRRELEKRLRKLADEHEVEFGLLRRGGNHDVYAFNGKRIPIPRHREIAERLAGAILDQAEEAL